MCEREKREDLGFKKMKESVSFEAKRESELNLSFLCFNTVTSVGRAFHSRFPLMRTSTSGESLFRKMDFGKTPSVQTQ